MSKLEAGGGHWKVEVGIEEEACIYRHGSSAYDKLVLQTMSKPQSIQARFIIFSQYFNNPLTIVVEHQVCVCVCRASLCLDIRLLAIIFVS